MDPEDFENHNPKAGTVRLLAINRDNRAEAGLTDHVWTVEEILELMDPNRLLQ
jgi:hypothetical protein